DSGDVREEHAAGREEAAGGPVREWLSDGLGSDQFWASTSARRVRSYSRWPRLPELAHLGQSRTHGALRRSPPASHPAFRGLGPNREGSPELRAGWRDHEGVRRRET